MNITAKRDFKDLKSGVFRRQGDAWEDTDERAAHLSEKGWVEIEDTKAVDTKDEKTTDALPEKNKVKPGKKQKYG